MSTPDKVARHIDKMKKAVLRAGSSSASVANVRFGAVEMRRNYAKWSIENLDGVDLNRLCHGLAGCGVYIRAPVRQECTTCIDVYVPIKPVFSWWVVALAAWAVCAVCGLLGLRGRMSGAEL